MKKYDVILKSKIQENLAKLPQLFEEDFLRDKPNQGMLLATVIFFSAVWIFAIVEFRVSDFLVPIRYNSFLGVTQVGSWYELYRTPIFLTFCIIINLLLGNLMYKKDRMVTYILIGTNIFLGFVAAILVFNFARLTGSL